MARVTFSPIHTVNLAACTDSYGNVHGSNAPDETLADYTSDGHRDLAYTLHSFDTNADCAETVFEVVTPGDGHGHFGSPVKTELPVGTVRTIHGDFNRDGVPDLALLVENQPTFSVFRLWIALGNGHGGFDAPQQGAGPADSSTPVDLGVGDFNGDGKLDVIVDNFQGDGHPSTLDLSLGDGSGGLAAPKDAADVSNSSGDFTFRDLNRDGRTDVAFLSTTANGHHGLWGNTVNTLLAGKTGSLSSSSAIAISNPGGIGIADANHDGHLDVVVAPGPSIQVPQPTTGNLRASVGDGTGHFSAVRVLGTGAPTSNGRIQQLAEADFSGDGRSDLAVRGDTLRVFTALVSGGLRSPASDSYTGEPFLGHIGAVADINGDRAADIAGDDGGTNVMVLAAKVRPDPAFSGVRLPKQAVTVSHGIARIRASCPAAAIGRCRGNLSLRTAKAIVLPGASKQRKLALGATSFSIAAGDVTSIEVHLSKAGLQALHSFGKFKTIATAHATDDGNRSKSTSGKVTLALKHKKKHRGGR